MGQIKRRCGRSMKWRSTTWAGFVLVVVSVPGCGQDNHPSQSLTHRSSTGSAVGGQGALVVGTSPLRGKGQAYKRCIMCDVRTNTLGKILAGEDAGWFVYVTEGDGEKGGYMTYRNRKANFSGDATWWTWHPNLDAVRRNFSAEGWHIEWLPGKIPTRFNPTAKKFTS